MTGTSTTATRRDALRRGLLATGGLVLGGTALTGTAAAQGADRCSLNWRRELSTRMGRGRPVINVTQDVVNDIDSGFNGYWADDDYRRLIQVWETAPDSYRAVVQYDGRFDGVEGAHSPGQDGGDPLSGEEDGTMHGGYAATIDGTLADDPDWPTRGFVGTTDYRGDVEAGTRPGAVDWVSDVYFASSSFSFEWWGWIYHGGRCGTWVNAQPGSCGDILCE